MPTECERLVAPPTTSAVATAIEIATTTTAAAHIEQQQEQQQFKHEEQLLTSMEGKDLLDEMSTSTGSTGSGGTTTNGHNGTSSNGGRKSSITSPDPTAYVAKARVTRPTPPPPSYNPMQFVQIKPCNLYQTAQQQLKKAEEVKKIKEIKKEEPEDWQNNLDSWKSSRRKRVEHIIDRVVEVKKLELEEHDRSRRKSKTFSEMIEERGERGVRTGRAKLVSLAVYNEDESNDLSDLGIGTSSASGKSSLSEDYDNNSVMSDNADLDKAIFTSNNHPHPSGTTREYISSPGYDTSSSTAPASSPDPCEYTYEGAIQDYKQRVSRATSGGSSGFKSNSQLTAAKAAAAATSTTSKESTPERGSVSNTTETYAPRRGSKIEERLIGFEVSSPNDSQDMLMMEKNQKVDLPKIDISKRKEMFESAANNGETKSQLGNGVPRVTLRDRFKLDSSATVESKTANKTDVRRLSGDIASIKDRLRGLEQQQNLVNATNGANLKLAEITVPPLKERLSSLQNAVSKEEAKKPPVALVDARQLQIMQDEEECAKQRMLQAVASTTTTTTKVKMSEPHMEQTNQSLELVEQSQLSEKEPEADRDDSGIHTADDVEEDQLQQSAPLPKQEHQQESAEQQLNDAIAALAIEEQQLELAANAVNQIEAEFAVLNSAAPATNEPPCEMEFSINEALELALDAIDKEATTTIIKTATNHTNDDSNNCKKHIVIATTTTITNTTMEQESEAKVEQKPEQATTNVKNDVVNEMKAKDLEKTDECVLEALVEEQLLKATNKKEEQDMIIALELEKTIKEKEYKEMQEFEHIAIKKVDNVYSLKQTENDYKIEENKEEEYTKEEHKKEKHKKEAHYREERQKEDTKQYEVVLDEQELIIQNEPIYENISTASITNVEAKIIPNNKKNNPNNIQNHTTYNNHEENNKSHNINLVDLKIEQETQLLTVAAAPPQITGQFPITTAPPQPLPQPPTALEDEPYYQVPKCNESYYDAPKHLRPIPLYENIDIFYSGIESATLSSSAGGTFKLEPPKEKPPPPPISSPTPSFEGAGGDDVDGDSLTLGDADNWSSDNTYETITNRRSVALLAPPNPSPPIKRMNSTKRIKKELRHKRSSFLGIESGGAHDDDDELESYLELTVAPPPDMAQLLQEERRLEKQLYLKAGLCDSSDTGESRDSGVSENHSRQSSEPYTNSSEEMEACGDESVSPATPLCLNTSPNTTHVYQHVAVAPPLQTPLLQTVKGNCAASWTESATAAAAASKSLTEATATANAKMLCIEEKIREQEEVLRVERELLQLEQEELKRQRENLQMRENIARRELQHGAKMLMSANRRSLQDLNDEGAANVGYQQQPLQQQQLPPQQIYANVPNTQQQDYYRRVDSDYRKSMSDLNEFSKRLSAAPLPPTKPMRALQLSGAQQQPMHDDYARRQSFGGGSLVKIAAPALALHQQSASDAFYSNYQAHHKSAQNLTAQNMSTQQQQLHSNMTRNTLHALSATPKPKYTDGWVQVQNRKSFDSNLSSDPAWLSAYQQKRKSMPDPCHYSHNNNNNNINSNNHWLVQEAEQRRLIEQQQQQQQRRSLSSNNAPLQQQNGGAVKTSSAACNGKPLPDSIIQTLTERVQSKGIGERKRFDNFNSSDKSPLHAAASYQHSHPSQQQQQQKLMLSHASNNHHSTSAITTSATSATTPDKVLSVSGKKKCSHCGDELGRGAAMIIESLLLFYHINCFKCCVCHVQLGDGLNGTDVRVRNHKLHCQNCYSSDDGIKFSCV